MKINNETQDKLILKAFEVKSRWTIWELHTYLIQRRKYILNTSVCRSILNLCDKGKLRDTGEKKYSKYKRPNTIYELVKKR